MLAPCMTVLSTSKNAAAAGSAGTSSAVSTSACRRGGLAGQRRALLQVQRRRAGRGRRSRAHPSRPGCADHALWQDPAMARLQTRPDPTSPTCCVAGRGRRTRPTGSPSSRPVVAALTWAELERPGRAVATGSGRQGVVAGHRVLIALRQPDRVRHDLPRRAAGPGGGRAGEPRGRRPASWPGCSPTRAPGWSSPTSARVEPAREAVAGPRARRWRAATAELDPTCWRVRSAPDRGGRRHPPARGASATTHLRRRAPLARSRRCRTPRSSPRCSTPAAPRADRGRRC